MAKGPIFIRAFRRPLSAIVLRRTTLELFKDVPEYEKFSMVSTLSTQSQDCRPITHCSRRKRRSMRLAQELGESDWDNG